jgi:hypothetical protein
MRSTAFVLWLMILLVFVPIGALHALALVQERAGATQVSAAPVGAG